MGGGAPRIPALPSQILGGAENSDLGEGYESVAGLQMLKVDGPVDEDQRGLSFVVDDLEAVPAAFYEPDKYVPCLGSRA